MKIYWFSRKDGACLHGASHSHAVLLASSKDEAWRRLREKLPQVASERALGGWHLVTTQKEEGEESVLVLLPEKDYRKEVVL